MPELPEVEYTARQLRGSVIGAEIEDVQVFWERTIGHPGAQDFAAEVVGKRITGVRRRGKFLLIDLLPSTSTETTAADFLSIHRRMTGNLLLLPPGWEIDSSLREAEPLAWSTRGPTFRETPIEEQSVASGQASTRSRLKPITDNETSYCRICFNLADGRRLLYTDQRKFGRIELWPCV